jgi:catechol 2,3-dioxygenase-like lactoylglutathione lyase family enzyme
MIDHVGFAVSDYAKSKAFFTNALAPLEIVLMVEIPPEHAGGKHHCGFGSDGKPDFWIGDSKAASATTHLAFVAKSRADVDRFHEAAMAAGGTDNGAPGLRPLYHPDYYAAFVLDPDGNNIEAVCHSPG